MAQGLELRPARGPVKNIGLMVGIILGIVLVACKLAMDFTASSTVRQIALWAAAGAFLLAMAVLLLQWNRSLLVSRRKDI